MLTSHAATERLWGLATTANQQGQTAVEQDNQGQAMKPATVQSHHYR